MSLNHQEIDAVLQELQLPGKAIQQIWQPQFDTLYIDCFHPTGSCLLLINLHSNTSRIHASNRQFPTKSAQPRFSTLLRARIKGARIEAVRQVNANRLIEFTLQKDDQIFFLIIRLWGANANIILCDHQYQIIDCAFRRPQRQEQSGLGFIYPDQKTQSTQFTIRDFPTSASFSHFLDQHYLAVEDAAAFAQTHAQIERRLEHWQVRTQSKVKNLEDQLHRISDPEIFRYYGDLIQAALHSLRGGEKELKTDDWFHPGENITIPLDPSRSAIANAEKWYQKYQKARDSRVYLEDTLAEHRRTLADIAQLWSKFEQCQNLINLQALNAELPPSSKPESKQDSDESDFPGVRFQKHGFNLMIGRNANENDALLRHHVRGNDYWLHARDWPGSYVFIKARKDKSPPLELLLDAAHLAVWYSRGRNVSAADVYYTQVKFLRRVKDGPKGLVIPSQEKNIHVRIDESRLKLLLGQ